MLPTIKKMVLNCTITDEQGIINWLYFILYTLTIIVGPGYYFIKLLACSVDIKAILLV